MATTKKAAAPAKKSSGFGGVKNAWIIMAICCVIAYSFYLFILGSPDNFVGGDVENGHPSNLMGTVYKGGPVVGLIFTLLLSVICLGVERFLALKTAFGTKPLAKFTADIKALIKAGDFDAAINLCNSMKGSVANVVSASIAAYKDVESNNTMKKAQKIAKIQQAHEEATQLEMPTLQMNLPIVATIVTLGTLTGLLGTVVGMIKAFSAMNASGGADSAELASGISEALINTAFGIGTSWCAVVSYNYFTNKVDKLTFALDEVGYSIAQTYEATHTEEA